MPTLGFGGGYFDPITVNTDALGGLGGDKDRQMQDLRDLFFGGGDTPGNTVPVSDINTDTGAKKRDAFGNVIDTGYDPGRNFVTPTDVQRSGLNTNDWGAAANYANTQNQANIEKYGKWPSELPLGKEDLAGTHILTGSDVQRMGLHQDDMAAAQRYADSVNKSNAKTAISMTPEQINLMGSQVNAAPTTPSLPDMGGTSAAAPAGPQAMAVGQGWYIDNTGQFHSDNEGANIRANRLGAGQGYSIGGSTLVDIGAPKTPIGAPGGLTEGAGPGIASAQDIRNAGARLPGGLGMQTAPAPTLADMQGTAAGTAGGPNAPAGMTGGYANYNPRLGDTTQQTYGTPNAPGTAAGGGAMNLPAGFQQVGGSRIVTGPDGTQYITDPSGFLNPNAEQARAWQSRAMIDQNAVTGFDPNAIEKIRYLDSIGQSTPEEKRFLQTIGTGNDFQNTQSYADWVNRHNPEAQRLGFSNQQFQQPSRILPMEQVFPVYKEYGDLLKQLGATNITISPSNHTTFGLGDNSAIMQWRSANGNPMKLSGDTPLANVLDDLATLRQIAAAQQAQHADAVAQAEAARTSGAGNRARAAYGGYGGGGYPGGGGTPGGGAPVTTQGQGAPANLPPEMVTGTNLYAGANGQQVNMQGYGPLDANARNMQTIAAAEAAARERARVSYLPNGDQMIVPTAGASGYGGWTDPAYSGTPFTRDVANVTGAAFGDLPQFFNETVNLPGQTGLGQAVQAGTGAVGNAVGNYFSDFPQFVGQTNELVPTWSGDALSAVGTTARRGWDYLTGP